MKFIVDAYESKKRVVIEYNEGWEDFSGYCGKDGLKHWIYIGKSTGPKHIPLSISSKRSRGGSALMTCREAIKKYYVKK